MKNFYADVNIFFFRYILKGYFFNKEIPFVSKNLPLILFLFKTLDKFFF